LGITVAFASASYFGLERPILRYKTKILWWDRRASRSAVGAPEREPAP
jgi:peptidoglycan/LPS O-acetylase OafA/YrhL